MLYAPPGGHPLYPARFHHPAVAGAVAVPHPSGQQVGDRFESPVRVGRKAGDIVLWIVGAEAIEQQKWVEQRQAVARDEPGQLYPSAILGVAAADDADQLAWFFKGGGHRVPPDFEHHVERV